MQFIENPWTIVLELTSVSIAILFGLLEIYRFFRGEYTKRMRSLIEPLLDDSGRSFRDFGGGIKKEDTSYWSIIHQDSRKHRILQHLYTYQKKFDIHLYDIYKDLLKTEERIKEINPEGKQLEGFELEQYTEVIEEALQLRIQFAKPFREIYEKLKRDSYSDCGACDDCLWYTRHNIFKYAFNLRKKKKSDPNAWDDSKW